MSYLISNLVSTLISFGMDFHCTSPPFISKLGSCEPCCSSFHQSLFVNSYLSCIFRSELGLNLFEKAMEFHGMLQLKMSITTYLTPNCFSSQISPHLPSSVWTLSKLYSYAPKKNRAICMTNIRSDHFCCTITSVIEWLTDWSCEALLYSLTTAVFITFPMFSKKF